MAARKITKTTPSVTTDPISNQIPADDPVVESELNIIENPKPVLEEKKEPRKFEQTDLILCRSTTPGWLALYGKSGNQYVWYNVGDVCEVEYGDLFALKNRRSRYLYDPLFVIEDDELLEHPRWKDIATFYDENVYGMDDIEAILNLPNNSFKKHLTQLPKGLKKALTIEVAKRIEDGSFDSIKKVKVIDEVCGTDFWKLMTGVDD